MWERGNLPETNVRERLDRDGECRLVKSVPTCSRKTLATLTFGSFPTLNP